MTSVLTLLLAGPLQSWGSSARFVRRTTERAPTKSGVVGLLAAAQGRDRTADLSDLAALSFGVRIDQPGTRVRDFHTAHHGETDKAMPVSQRFYLADAVFVAAVEGDDTLLTDLRRALRAPYYLPFLGRRSCPPARPVDLTLHRRTRLWDALEAEAWQASVREQRRRGHERHVDLEVVMDLDGAGAAAGAGALTTAEAASGRGPLGDSLRDQPLSFDPRHRRYGLRGICSRPLTVRNPHSRERRHGTPPGHDPMLALEGD